MVGFTWPLVWIAVAVVAAIAEGVTAQLVSIWMVISALATAVAAGAGLAVVYQWAMFAALSLVLLVLSRPLLMKRLAVKRQATNVEQVIGKEGAVVCHGEAAPRVKVMGLEWAARTSDGSSLTDGQRVTIQEIQGATLVVTCVSDKDEAPTTSTLVS